MLHPDKYILHMVTILFLFSFIVKYKNDRENIVQFRCVKTLALLCKLLNKQYFHSICSKLL